tara:strand:+ start:495 stop:686 length:192 start_codon:yes stop_codon:yes gene_type:complete
MRVGVGFRGASGVQTLQNDVVRRRRLMQDETMVGRKRSAAMIEAAEMLGDADVSQPTELRASA